MKKIGLLLISLLFIIDVNAKTTIEKVTFNRCVDGDTAVFNVGEEETKFRFLAIDTPETVHPTKEVEAFGKDASEYTCNKLTNAKSIIVEYETSNKTDKYGRSLAWIWVDGSLLQQELIDAGYAKVAYIYGKYRYTESLCLAQSKAKENTYGLWNDEKEDGYCSTVDLTNVENNIDFGNIGQEELTDEEQKAYGVLEKIDSLENKVGDYFGKDPEKVQNTMYYVIVGLAIFFVIMKELKK